MLPVRSGYAPAAKHDACYLPRRAHTTGDIQIHEMAWINNELVFVNTAFSCLATRSDHHSFDLRWRPPFITQLVPGDFCHLNGLALRDGRIPPPSKGGARGGINDRGNLLSESRMVTSATPFSSAKSSYPAYVTALGETSAPSGWRDNKRNGGILIDVKSNEFIARGLSMPHSPRWHRDELWLLESGDGFLGRVDLNTGRYEPIIRLPGFTRGLSFLGPLAFVGLSQVRESATFSGIPLVERLTERVCGVWVVNIDIAEIIAFVRFEDAVQEIFAVEVLPGVRYPDLINHDPQLIGRSYVPADDALALVPQALQQS